MWVEALTTTDAPSESMTMAVVITYLGLVAWVMHHFPSRS